MQKLTDLQNWLRQEGRTVVALSGGIDSTLLAYVAGQVLGANAIAVTGRSASVPETDMGFVKEFCLQYQIEHKYIDTHEFNNEEFRKNPENRCYYCKGALFKELQSFALENNYASVLDGTNASDLGGHRPGYKAIQEIEHVKVPYVELNITKQDIRDMAKELGLEVADKPASACLASRVPWGKRIEPTDLLKVDKAEQTLRAMGFTQIRVRHHDDIARIQTIQSEISKAIELRNKIKMELTGLGYKHVTIDMRCYGE